jgi:hypothetical protein
MAMVGICFDLENYTACERIFKQSSEFCKDHDTWKLNVAHTFFMREAYKDAIRWAACLPPLASCLLVCREAWMALPAAASAVLCSMDCLTKLSR